MKQTIETTQCMQLQGKFSINMLKLMIKCRLLPLNVNSFFDLELECCGSMKMLKHSSKHRVQHCGEFCKCLKM